MPAEDNPLFRVFAKPHVLDWKEIPKPIILATIVVEASLEEPMADTANVVESGQPRNRAKVGSRKMALNFRVPQPA